MNILHLEDDGPLREILAAALRAVEPTCDLHQFVESDNAIQYAQDNTQAIDLFILDIRVPGSVDGVEVARRVRAMKCRGAIVLTSAYRAPAPELIKELDCEWFPKPWHILEATTKLLSLAQKNIAAAAALSKPVETAPAPQKVEGPKPVEPAPTPLKAEETKPAKMQTAPLKAEETKPAKSVTAPLKPESLPVEAAPVSLKVEESKPAAPALASLNADELKPAAPAPAPIKVEETKPNEAASTSLKTDAT